MVDLTDELPKIILIGILSPLLQIIGKASWPRVRARFPVVHKMRRFECQAHVRALMPWLLLSPAENAAGGLIRACFFMCIAALALFGWDQLFDDAEVPLLLYLVIVAAAVGWSIMGHAADRVSGSIRPRPLRRAALLAYWPSSIAAWIAHSLFYVGILLFFVNCVQFGISEAIPGLTGTAIVFLVARYLDRTGTAAPVEASGFRLPSFVWRAMKIARLDRIQSR